MTKTKTCAWLATEQGENYSTIVFSKSERGAQKKGCRFFDDVSERDEVSVKRAPEYDVFSDAGRVPLSVLISKGWQFECCGCGCDISLDAETEDGEPFDYSNVVEKGEYYWCSDDCRMFEEQTRAERFAAHEALKAHVLKLRPDLTFTYFSCDDGVTGKTCQSPVAKFTFPGAQVGGSFKIEHLEDKPDVVLYIAMGDLEAWKRYETDRKK
jgi:hypothetical protein